MSPTVLVACDFGFWKVEVAQLTTGAAVEGSQEKFDRRRSGRQVVAACKTPCEHHTSVGLDHQVFASHGVASDVNGKLSTWCRVEVSVLPHPRRHAFVGGQVVEYGLGWRGDVDEVLELSHSSPPAAR